MTDFTKLDAADLARVTTRDGRNVRILCTDGPEESPIAAWIEGELEPRSFRANGGYYGHGQETGCDLSLPPAERVVWLREYGPGSVVETYKERPRMLCDDYPDYRITLGDSPTIERVK